MIDDDLYRAVRPMLAVSDGKIFAIGTPHGKRGWFYHTWTESEQFRKIKITADQCPRITREFLREERKALGQYWFEQEYECEFHQSETSLFRMDVVDAAVIDFDEIDFDYDGDVSENNNLDLDVPDLTEDVKLDLD